MVILPFAAALSLAMFTGFTLSAAQSLLPITGIWEHREREVG